MRLAAESIACFSGLLGSKVALLPLDDLEQGVGRRWLLVWHTTNIQGICINMQDGLGRLRVGRNARLLFPFLVTADGFGKLNSDEFADERLPVGHNTVLAGGQTCQI